MMHEHGASGGLACVDAAGPIGVGVSGERVSACAVVCETECARAVCILRAADGEGEVCV